MGNNEVNGSWLFLIEVIDWFEGVENDLVCLCVDNLKTIELQSQNT